MRVPGQYPRPHVLIVDDNDLNLHVAEACCDLLHLTSSVAHSGAEAVQAVQTQAFDLVLMDIRMPGMDGVQAAQAIHDLGPAFRALPIVAMTAEADPADALRYEAAGLCATVSKPIQVRALREAIASALASPLGKPRSAAPGSA